MTKGCVGGILNVLAVLVIITILLNIGFNALGTTLAVFAGIGICFLDYWIYYGTKSILKRKQTHVICPRCKILVDKESDICPQCNNRV